MEYQAETEEEVLASFVYRMAFEFGKEGNTVESLATFCREQNAEHLLDNAVGFWQDGVDLYPENQ